MVTPCSSLASRMLALAEPHHGAVQSLVAIEAVVGQRVEDVEPRHPGRDRDA